MNSCANCKHWVRDASFALKTDGDAFKRYVCECTVCKPLLPPTARVYTTSTYCCAAWELDAKSYQWCIAAFDSDHYDFYETEEEARAALVSSLDTQLHKHYGLFRLVDTRLPLRQPAAETPSEFKII